MFTPTARLTYVRYNSRPIYCTQNCTLYIRRVNEWVHWEPSAGWNVGITPANIPMSRDSGMECNKINTARRYTVHSFIVCKGIPWVTFPPILRPYSGFELFTMHFHTTWIGLLVTLPSAWGFWPIDFTESSSPYRNDAPTVKVETLFQFPNNGSWVDNLALRSDGSILLTRLDTPEVWSVDATSGNATLVHSFANATSCFGISEIDDDVFAVVVGNFSTKTYQPTPGSFTVQQLDFNNVDATENEEGTQMATVSHIAALPEAQALNGMASFTKESHLVLIADSPKGVAWKLNTQTGEYSVALNDTTMLPAAGQALPLGVNGLKLVDDYIYYSSTTRMQFGRVKVNQDATPAGDYEIIASGFLPDNLDVTSDGTAYIATDPQNSVVRITPYGQISLVAGGQLSTQMPGPTSCRLSADGKTLYVGTSGGQVAPVLGTFMEPAKVVKITFE